MGQITNKTNHIALQSGAGGLTQGELGNHPLTVGGNAAAIAGYNGNTELAHLIPVDDHGASAATRRESSSTERTDALNPASNERTSASTKEHMDAGTNKKADKKVGTTATKSEDSEAHKDPKQLNEENSGIESGNGKGPCPYERPKPIDMCATDAEQVGRTWIQGYEYEIAYGRGNIADGNYFENLEEGKYYDFGTTTFGHGDYHITTRIAFTAENGDLSFRIDNAKDMIKPINDVLNCRDKYYGPKAYREHPNPEMNTSWRFEIIPYGARFGPED
jgi:hypothetical protein